jgi:hypothetical protein
MARDQTKWRKRRREVDDATICHLYAAPLGPMGEISASDKVAEMLA